MRIVSLCPSNTETLGYIGLAGELVGVDDYSDWPPDIEPLPRLGSDMAIDIESVAALKPDLVLASLSVPGMEKNIAGLQAAQLPYLTLNAKSLAAIGNNLLEVGAATGRREEARAAYDKYTAVLEEYAAYAAGICNRPSLYWEWWPKPVFTPGGLNWLTEISELAGARNVFAEEERASVKTDWEDVRSRDPDYVFLAWVGVRPELIKPESVGKRPGGSELRAVREGKTFVMEEQWYCRPSPRLLVGLRQLAAWLHPEDYPAFDKAQAEVWR